MSSTSRTPQNPDHISPSRPTPTGFTGGAKTALTRSVAAYRSVVGRGRYRHSGRFDGGAAARDRRVAPRPLAKLALFGGPGLLLFQLLQPLPAQAQTFYSVCSRTLWVQEEVIKAVRNLESITPQQRNQLCGSVGGSALAGITSLDFSNVAAYHNTGILKVGDFDNLTGLTRLDLSGLGLLLIKPRRPRREEDPDDSIIHLGELWGDLASLEYLSLADNKLYPRLPDNAFQGLGGLEELDLRNYSQKPGRRDLVCNLDARETSPDAFVPLTGLQTYNGSAYTAAPPAAPTNLAVTRSGDVFTLTWAAPGGATVTGYRIGRNVNNRAPREYERGCSVGPGEQIRTTASGTRQYRDDMSWIRTEGRGYDALWSLEYHVNARNAGGLGPTATLRLSEEMVKGTPKLRALLSIGREDRYGVWIQGQFYESKYSQKVPFEVTLWPASTDTVTVQYATREGTATEGVDYTAQSGTLTFQPGETKKTVRVPVIDDTVDDSGEDFYLVLSTASGAPIAIAEAKGTIYNDDPPPNLSVADAEGTEGDYATLDFVVTLNPAVEVTATVDYATSDGTATAGEDYTAKSGTLTFEPGRTTQTIAVPIIDDDVDDDGETVTLTLSNPSGETISDGEATGTIRDGTDGSTTSSEPLWSADMLVVDYGEGGSIGAGSADLLTNQGGSAGLKGKWLFYNRGNRELNLAFTTVIEDAPGLKLWMGSDVLAFSGGDSGITWFDVQDMGWADGDTIKVFVTKGGSVVEPPANTAPTGAPTISGTARVGETLTASVSAIADADGLDSATFAYQWVSSDGTDDTDIEDATSSTYTLVAADAGKTIKVRVSFTDDNGTEETLVSAATDTVAKATATEPSQLSVADAEAAEGDSVAFTVSLSAASSQEITVDYATSGGTAESGTDFTAVSGTLTFAANDTSKTVSVATADDSDDEQDETFALTLSNPANATLADTTATGTINDNDEAPTPTVSVADASATEGDSVAFTVSLSAASSQQITVDYATSGGTAESGADFMAASGTLTFAANDTAKTVSVATVDDSDDEENETFTLTLSNPANATLADTMATGTITDDDEASTPTVSVADASATEGDSVAFTVSLSAASSGQITVDYATSGGTATSGTDFTAASGTLTFAANDTSQTVSVATADDSDDEENETFTLTLSNPAGATLADTTATGTINDDDEAATVLTATFSDMPASHDGSSEFTFRLTFSEEPEVGYETLRDDAFEMTGGAVEKARRQQQGSNLAWDITVAPSGTGAVTITLPETTDCDATGAICTDDDRPLSHSLSATVAGPVILPTLSVSDASATEGDSVGFTVSLSAASSQQVTVDYATSGGTATSGTDFTAASGTLTFSANETSKTVSVATTDDSDDEEDETFTLTLSNPANATLDDANGTGTINDDDEAPTPTLSVSDASATEGDTVAFTVSLSAASSQQVTVDYATSGGTATSGTDFTEASGTLTFSANETSKTVSVSTTDDSDDEENETFTLTLSDPSNATLDDASGTGTITDDDEAPTPTLSVSDASATEGDAVAFTVSLSAASSQQVTVAYATSGGTATSGTDFTAASGTLTFSASETSQTVNVSTTDDSVDEEDETFTLTLSNPANATLDDASGTGTINDDDEAPTPTVSVSDASATEGDAVVFTVSLSAASSQQVTVDYATSGGTATSGTDYTAASGTLTFSANETSKTVSVSTTDDSVDEEDETFTLTLSNPANATLDDATATGTINDDDEAATPLTASFSGMPASHVGEEFTFGLTFSEDVKLSFRTLRDDAFNVTGGTVRRARRQQQGSNQAWDITVGPASATDTVKIRLPETTDCTATGAICTHDGRKLSNSLSAMVVPASASASDAPNRNAVALDDALAVADGVTPDDATAALFGELKLSEARLAALDRLGNRNGRYDLGDVLSWIDRCRRGEAHCGTTSTGPSPVPAAALLTGVATSRRGSSRRRSRRDPGRRGHSPRTRPRVGMVRYALAMLLAATMSWSCTGDLAGPPAAAVADPGFLTVEWTGPPTGRDIGVLMQIEGPGIETVRAPGLDLYQSSAPGPRQIVVTGSLRTGPLLQFRVPDRNQLPLYRVRILEVTSEDYGLRDVAEYRAVITNN